MNKASTPAPVVELVERFSRDRAVFRSGDYKEEQLRAEFLNPFFSALGWDMDNKAGLSETYKPVIHEESLKVASTTEAIKRNHVGRKTTAVTPCAPLP